MRALSYALLSLIILAGSVLIVRAANLTVSLSVGLTYFTVNGYTSPGSSVTLTENGSVIGTTAADGSGYYEITIQGTDGIHTYGIYGVDAEGNTTPTISHTVSLTPGSTTTIGDLILPPTLVPSTVDTEVGTDIELKGFAAPLSDIYIFFSNELMATVQTDSAGLYSGHISTGNYNPGTHALTTRIVRENGNSSLDSQSYVITLRDKTLSSSPSPSIEYSPLLAPTQQAERQEPRKGENPLILHFDPNGDGTLTDSELEHIVKHWIASWKVTQDGHCDLNRDGECTLVDFSILMYYIER